MDSSSKHRIAKYSLRALHWAETAGLATIAIATVAAGYGEVSRIIGVGEVTLGDLLLLFIYLEVLAMVSFYHEAGSLPVRMPLYIAIVALARHMALDMKTMTEWQLLASAGAILIVTAAVLLLKIGKNKFPDFQRPQRSRYEDID